jgi:energy-coupling factor transport system permease protein
MFSPERKIILYIFFVFSLMLLKNITIYLFIFAAISIFLVRMPFRSLRSGWVPISFFLLFTFIGNLLFQHGKIIYSIGPLLITEEGLESASVRTLRVLFMIVGAKILTATTDVELLVNAIANILRPLERFGIPVSEFFSAMCLAIKSLPRIKDQMAAIYRERVKGGKITGFWNRARAVSVFLMPLIVRSIQSPEKFLDKDSNDAANLIRGSEATKRS